MEARSAWYTQLYLDVYNVYIDVYTCLYIYVSVCLCVYIQGGMSSTDVLRARVRVHLGERKSNSSLRTGKSMAMSVEQQQRP